MSQVRVRIAPSPTGSPHVGTAYMALFNYAFAKSHNGKFILRIEDTDRTRSRPKYERDIFEALKWLGLSWDEGPDIGGEFGPYRQSERFDLYKQYTEKLMRSDGAYRCFCTPERLQKMREEQLARQLPLKYDGKCRHLSESAVGLKLKDKEPYTVRLKVPRRGKCVISDRLRPKKVTYNYKEIDDQILLKSDGFPTYHLANVVDDHLMKITHVIRGEEWLSSTPKHVLLYEAFDWPQPEFIHMPLLLNADGSKLSKRKNPTSIFYYRDAGFLPEALMNFLGLMGYSRPDSTEEKFSLEEMCSDFSIDRVSLGGSVFDIEKLSWLSGRYFRENLSPEEIFQRLQNWRLNENHIKKFIPLAQQRINTLGDFMPLCSFYWSHKVSNTPETYIPKKKEIEDVVRALQIFLFAVDESNDWKVDPLKLMVQDVAQFLDWKPRDLLQPLFVAITGKRVSTPLFESMEHLGRDLCRVRILDAIKILTEDKGVSKKKLQKYEQEWGSRKVPQ